MRIFRLPVLLILAVLILSGCFQPASEGIQATPVGQGPVVAPPIAIEPSPTSALVFTQPTQDLSGEAQPLAEATQAPLVFNTAVPVDGQGGQEVTPAPVSGAAMTATAMIAQAMGLQGTPTQPAITIQIATATPFVMQQPLSENEILATALVAGATATGYWRETATATAMGILAPTLTPAPTTTLLAAQILPPGTDCVHVVRRGENTYRIALRYGTTIADIARANGLANATVISVGQELRIPGCGNLTPTPGVPAGDATTGGIGETAGSCGSHLIQPGENLYRIALRYGVTMAALRNANSIASVNVIKAGDTLSIPCR
jgi:LysM repeat protein